MSTTTKTLTPTNQTITLPDMTERPNASVLVDGIGKEADAINALSDQINTKFGELAFVSAGTIRNTSSKTLTFSGNVYALVICDAANSDRTYMGILTGTTTNVVITELYKGNSISVTTGTGTITFASSATSGTQMYILVFNGTDNITVS